MIGDRMDFEALVPGSLRALMISALGQVARHGLAGEHHFFITYDTSHDDVKMSESLRAQYPETITIVLQHEFWELVVSEDGFSVSLAFNGVPHQLSVPFDAVTGFADPSINFSIQLQAPQSGGAAAAVTRPPPEDKAEPDSEPGDRKPGDVIALDTFRKK